MISCKLTKWSSEGHASRGCSEQEARSRGPLNSGIPTCSRQEPRATPSKNWWNVSAASSGRMVQGELLTPSAMPMSTEWKAMPVSSTCSREAPPN